MLDKKTTAVLTMLAQQVGYNYKVVKKQTLLSALPKKYSDDVQSLVAIIAFLKEKDFLSVKYQDKEEICLALSVKAETYLSQDVPSAESQIPTKQAVWLLLGVFAFAFLGAFAAVLVGKLI